MTAPIEFTEAYIRASSEPENELFRGFLRSGEPFKSMLENNPWLQPPNLKQPLVLGRGHYWDSTMARKHDYWKHLRCHSRLKTSLNCVQIFEIGVIVQLKMRFLLINAKRSMSA